MIVPRALFRVRPVAAGADRNARPIDASHRRSGVRGRSHVYLAVSETEQLHAGHHFERPRPLTGSNRGHPGLREVMATSLEGDIWLPARLLRRPAVRPLQEGPNAPAAFGWSNLAAAQLVH